MRSIRDLIIDAVGNAITNAGMEPIERTNGDRTIVYGFKDTYHAQIQFEIHFGIDDFDIQYLDPERPDEKNHHGASYISGPDIEQLIGKIERTCERLKGATGTAG